MFSMDFWMNSNENYKYEDEVYAMPFFKKYCKARLDLRHRLVSGSDHIDDFTDVLLEVDKRRMGYYRDERYDGTPASLKTFGGGQFAFQQRGLFCFEVK